MAADEQGGTEPVATAQLLYKIVNQSRTRLPVYGRTRLLSVRRFG